MRARTAPIAHGLCCTSLQQLEDLRLSLYRVLSRRSRSHVQLTKAHASSPSKPSPLVRFRYARLNTWLNAVTKRLRERAHERSPDRWFWAAVACDPGPLKREMS